MKKFVCLLMALAMVFSLSVTAGAVETIDSRTFGEPDGGGNWTKSAHAYVTVDDETSDAKVYYVTVGWGDLTFVYKMSDGWDPSTHTYSSAAGGTWQEETGDTVVGNTITRMDIVKVKNDSNDRIKVTASIASAAAGRYDTTIVGDLVQTIESADADDYRANTDHENLYASYGLRIVAAAPAESDTNLLVCGITVSIDKAS